MPELTNVNVQMPVALDTRIRRVAADMRISRPELIRLAIEDFLAQENMVAHTAEAIQRVEAASHDDIR